jgi:hypothetical protein
MVVGDLGDRLAFGIQHEAEWLKKRTEDLDAQLSTLSSMQLKVPVSTDAFCHDPSSRYDGAKVCCKS